MNSIRPQAKVDADTTNQDRGESRSGRKNETEFVENLEPIATHATHIGKDEIALLSEEHRQYLLRRHGTLILDPVPGFGDADPLNWRTWKVRVPNRVEF
jgi:hypothetical protein